MKTNSAFAKANEPDPFASLREKKTKKYGLSQAKYLYSSYFQNRNTLFYDRKTNYREQIAYAQGDQSLGRYRKFFGIKKNDQSWINLDWRIRNYLTKRINAVTHMIYSEEYRATFDAIDPMAIQQKREYKGRIRAIMEMKEFYDEMAALSEVAETPPDNLPMTEAELNLHMDEEYKHRFARELEQANEVITDISDWKMIQKQFAFDLAVLGVGAIESKIGKNGMAQNSYVDPLRLVVPNSKYEDYRDIHKIGWVEDMQIHNLRKVAGKQFTDNEYEQIKEEYSTKESQRNLHNYHDYTEGYQNANHSEQSYQVPVLHFSFITDIEDTYVQKITPENNAPMYPANPNKGMGKGYWTEKNEYGVGYKTNGKVRVYRDKFEVVMQGSWIVGSDFVFNYAPAYNMERDKKNLNKAHLPIKVISPNMKANKVVSIVDQAMPICDDIQNYTNKLNQLVAAAIPKGIYINLDSLEEANLAGSSGEVMDTQELLRMYQEKGVVVGRNKDYTGGASDPYPIRELENGMARDVMNYVQLIDVKRRELDEVIGLNEMTYGALPNPKTGKAVAQASMNQSMHTIGHLFLASRWLYEQATRSNCRNYLEMLRRGNAHDIIEALGESSLDFMSQDPSITLHQFGFKVDVLPKEQEWQEFYQLIASAIGTPDGIDIDDFVYIKNLTNLKQAESAFRTKLRMKRDARALQEQAAAEQAQQAQAQQAQMLAEMKAQEAAMLEEEKRKTLTVEFELKKDLAILEGQITTQSQQELAAQKAEIDDHLLKVKAAAFDLFSSTGATGATTKQ